MKYTGSRIVLFNHHLCRFFWILLIISKSLDVHLLLLSYFVHIRIFWPLYLFLLSIISIFTYSEWWVLVKLSICVDWFYSPVHTNCINMLPFVLIIYFVQFMSIIQILAQLKSSYYANTFVEHCDVNFEHIEYWYCCVDYYDWNVSVRYLDMISDYYYSIQKLPVLKYWYLFGNM